MNNRPSLRLPVLAGWLLLVSPGLTVGQAPDSPAPPPPGAGPSGLTPAQALEKAWTEIAAAEEARESGSGEWQLHAKMASQLADFVLSAQPLNARAQFIKGRVLLLEGRTREARALIQEYTEDEREGRLDWLGFKLLGDILLEGKYYELADAKYKQALKLNRNEPQIFFGLARAAINRLMPEEAADYARQGIALQSPPRAQDYALLAQTRLGSMRTAMTDPDAKSERISDLQMEAQSAARRAVELAREKVRENPSRVNRLNQLNNLLTLQRAIEESRLILQPERANVYMDIARIVQDQADLARLMTYHQAIGILERGVEATGENVTPDLLYELARLMYAVGRVEDSRATLVLLLETYPDHAEGQALLAKVGKPPTPEEEDQPPSNPAAEGPPGAATEE
jgi:tetratricopeptide (TPR) repeat protein